MTRLAQRHRGYGGLVAGGLWLASASALAAGPVSARGVTLHYSAADGGGAAVSAPVSVVVRCGLSGQRWVLALVPDRDVAGRAVVIDLTLRAETKTEPATHDGSPARVEDQNREQNQSENLLYGGRPLHGLQPFQFAAADFLHGIAASAYGRRRVVTVAHPPMVLRLVPTDVVLARDAVPPFIFGLGVRVALAAPARVPAGPSCFFVPVAGTLSATNTGAVHSLPIRTPEA